MTVEECLALFAEDQKLLQPLHDSVDPEAVVATANAAMGGGTEVVLFDWTLLAALDASTWHAGTRAGRKVYVPIDEHGNVQRIEQRANPYEPYDAFTLTDRLRFRALKSKFLVGFLPADARFAVDNILWYEVLDRATGQFYGYDDVHHCCAMLLHAQKLLDVVLRGPLSVAHVRQALTLRERSITCFRVRAAREPVYHEGRRADFLIYAEDFLPLAPLPTPLPAPHSLELPLGHVYLPHPTWQKDECDAKVDDGDMVRHCARRRAEHLP